MVNSHDPHRPFYDPNGRGMKGEEVPSRLFKPEEMVIPSYLPDLPKVREEYANYFSSILRLDDTVGRVLLALDTGKLIRRTHAKVIPMTTEVIARVNHLRRDKSRLFTFTNRQGEEVGEQSLNCIKGSNDEPIEHEVHDIGDAGDGDNPNLDVVDDVAGVDGPYEPYVDDWNDDVPYIGNDAIDQDVAEATDYNIIDTAEAVFEAGEMEFQPTLGNSDLKTLQTQPEAPRGVALPTQDGGGRPTRVQKPVSWLVPSFKGKT
jgi:hypothetical protein